MKHLLIDGDPLVYRSCMTKAVSTVEDCCGYLDSVLDHILWTLLDYPTENDYTIYLSGKGNYRKDLYPDYKANRVAAKPSTFNSVMEYTKTLPNVVVCDGYEADDGISMAAHRRGFKNVLIVSSDKDFKQFPVEIYSTYSWSRETISKKDAVKNFWVQVLMGDSVDNIKGCKGIGVKKARKLLATCKKPSDHEAVVIQTYQEVYGEDYLEHYIKAYTLVKLLSNLKELDNLKGDLNDVL